MPAVAALSNQNIFVPVRSDHPISGAVNITAYPVDVAITIGDPISTDWKPAVWESTTKRIKGVDYYLARLEIGPNGGALTLTADVTYHVHARITAPTETPVVYAGALQTY